MNQQQPSEDYVDVLLVPHTHPNATQPFRVRGRYQILCDSPEQNPEGVWRNVSSVYRVPPTRFEPTLRFEFALQTNKAGKFEYAIASEHEVIAARRLLINRNKRKVLN